ncbi:mevalonate kinase [Pendulispora albinea]|uniref:Mevalonate kinase n=1 Tax=Pendulispora albinea TaxID=2741071 RepID=A0ABZ2M6J2_9BACT
MQSGRAHGKVILVGEHAVVHGVPAIAVGIDRGCVASARPLPRGPSQLSIAAWNAGIAEDDASDLARGYRALLDASRGAIGSGAFAVEVSVDLPAGAGLGCSAAVAISIARALDPGANVSEIEARAMAWERVFHGNPSGIDAAVCARGGALSYRRPGPGVSMALDGVLHLAIGHSGMAASTKAMVASVARQMERRPEFVGEVFASIADISAAATRAIQASDREELGKLLDANQRLLAALGLSTPDLERMCELARGSGALGAKLTGSGGGGCAVALAPSAHVARGIVARWKHAGYTGFATVAGQEKPVVPRALRASEARSGDALEVRAGARAGVD